MRCRLAFALCCSTLLAADPDEIGSKACVACHAGIYRTYVQTGMARTSGRTGGTPHAAAFEDNRIGARYRIVQRNDGLRLQYARQSTHVSGTLDLTWFIGSGKVGRSYAFATDGFLFQAPASYYSAPGRWGLSPGYAGKREIDIAKPVEPACLNCHSSRIQHVPGTQNRYQDSPFLEDGVSCERCHGAGRRHVESMQAGSRELHIVNPVKLASDRRDSICLQCHLTGAARVAKTAAGPASFRPGDRLSDHLAVFVWSDGARERTATDHAEQLSRSRCQQAAGAKLWCGTCHNSHSEPAPEQRVAFYRRACVQCHDQQTCPVNGDDCASCHMPKGPTREGEHVVYTSHLIQRQPASPIRTKAGSLRSFWQTPVSDRDAALAYASQPSMRGAAMTILEKLASTDTTDVAALAQLAQIHDGSSQSTRAVTLYERVLRLDPLHPSAANLAVHRFQAGRTREAIDLWERVFQHNPALAGPGLNLAMAYLKTGNAAAARSSLLRVLRFHPDNQIARELVAEAR